MTLDIHHEKLKEAVDIVTKGQLKNNADDTLIEKLISFVETLQGRSTESSNDDDKFDDLLYIINHSTEAAGQAEDKLAISLRLIGVILASPNLFADKRENVTKALDSVTRIASGISHADHYVLQVGLIRCLTSFASHAPGCDWICTAPLECNDNRISLIQKVYEIQSKATSFFVQTEAEKLVIKLIKQNSAEGGVKDEESGRPTTLAVTITNIRNRKVHDSFYCEVLALTGSQLMKKQQIEYFIAAKNYKPLINLLTVIMQQNDRENFILKWFEYVVYALRPNSRPGEISWPPRERQFPERGRISPLRGVLMDEEEIRQLKENVNDQYRMLALHALKASILSSLAKPELEIVVTQLTKLVEEELPKQGKCLFEAISALDRALSQLTVVNVPLMTMAVRVLQTQTDRRTRRELLKCIRNHLNRLDGKAGGSQWINSFIVILRGYFQVFLKRATEAMHDEIESEENMEDIDSVLEVFACLPDHFANDVTNLSAAESEFWALWTAYEDHPSFRVSAAPVVVSFCPSSHDVQKPNFQELSLRLADFLSVDSPSLSLKVIETFSSERNMTKLMYIEETFREMFYSNIATSLCLLALDATDNELQLATLQLWTLIIQKISENENMQLLDIRISNINKARLPSVLYYLLNSDLDGSERVTDAAEQLRTHFRSYAMRDLSAKEKIALDQLNLAPSTESNGSDGVKEKEETEVLAHDERKGIVEELFRGFTNQPTLDFINELNNRQSERRTNKKDKENKTKEVDHESLITFMFSEKIELRRQQVNEYAILDDIIAAKEVKNVASVDCY